MEDLLDDIIDNTAFHKLTYGLFVLGVRNGNSYSGCIVNTVQMLTDTPKRISLAVNKRNFTNELLQETGELTISVLTNETPFAIFKNFGFQSGRDVAKFEEVRTITKRASNGIPYLIKYTNAFISARVISAVDYDTHTLFVAEVTEAMPLSNDASVTYGYYLNKIKPRPQQVEKKDVKRYECTVCGYVYEGEIPDDFCCPICHHGASDFVLIE